jgi:predicted ArsR family transcriptional regulator
LAEDDGMERLAALGAPGALQTLAYARAAGGPFSVDEAAAALGCHRSVARQRLDRLESAGLLLAEFRRPPGRTGPGAGRPPKLFRAAPEVALTEYPSRRYAQLIALLSGEEAGQGTEGSWLRAVGRRYAATLAGGAPRPARQGRLDRAVPQMCALLGRLGFSARPGALEPDRAELRVPTCPLRPAVFAGASVAEVDGGMWEGLAELALSRSLRVRCATADCLDGASDCTVTLFLERGSRAAAQPIQEERS